MLIQECNGVNPSAINCFPATWGITARPCDSCKSTAALLYCRPDSVFLCITCDAKIHPQKQARHERVWICQVCEQAPATVTCKADAAALCLTCDRDIHSANPLAGRHERLPVSPFYDTAESILLKSSSSFAAAAVLSSEPDLTTNSYLPPNATNPDEKFGDFDHPLSDSVVPVVQAIPIRPLKAGELVSTKKDCYFELDFSNPNGLFPPNPTSVSSACLDAGVVPDGNSICDTSNSIGRGMDREARVHRYREKRKNRRYDKMIRYASRKAYAESRPRIKGRFAKRTVVEQEEEEEEEMMGFGNRSSPAGFLELMEAGGYGVVPSLLLN